MEHSRYVDGGRGTDNMVPRTDKPQGKTKEKKSGEKPRDNYYHNPHHRIQPCSTSIGDEFRCKQPHDGNVEEAMPCSNGKLSSTSHHALWVEALPNVVFFKVVPSTPSWFKDVLKKKKKNMREVRQLCPRTNF